MHRAFIIALVFFLFGGGSTHASATPPLEIQVESNRETLMLTLPGTLQARVFTLDHPDRLVVDIPLMPKRQKIALPAGYTGMIGAVRQGQFDASTTRIVFELAAPPGAIGTRSSSATGQETQLQISLNTAGNAAAAPAAAAPAAAAVPALAPAPVKAPKEKSRDARPVIVIDAGHGGVDPGALGAGGVHEKDIVFAYAQALKQALLATGRYRVVMTRDDDRFIMLRERVVLARRAGGQLFISLHADSAPDGEARGLSVYTLSETASDKQAAALAERENRVDVVYGMDLSDKSQDVAGILLSLAQRDTVSKSASLAELFMHALASQGVALLQNTHRFAGFAVLKSPDIPSVLVELGFVTHPREVRLLQSAAYRARIIKGLVAGADDYFASRRLKEAREG